MPAAAGSLRGVDVTGEDRGRLARIAAWFEATPAELTGLLVLLAGALVASVALWVSATQRPDAVPPGAAAEGGAGSVGEAAVGDVLGDGATGHDPGEHGAGGPGDGVLPPGEGPTGAPPPPAHVTVHVTGAVATPGVVTLPGGARVADAVAAAGGATTDADPERINLARQVQDGEHVHLPRVGEDPPPVVDGHDGGQPSGVTADGRVDLNRATPDELETLPGIGPAKAASIVAHREEHGPFQAPGDVREVTGIGEKTFQQLADLITVSP